MQEPTTLFLSRLILNPRSRDVRADLANCQAMHCRTLQAFPSRLNSCTDPPTEQHPSAREEFGVLYRVDEDRRTGKLILLVQSHIEPDWQVLPPSYLLDTVDASNPETKPIAHFYQVLAQGQQLAFRLRANPTESLPRKERDANGRWGRGIRASIRDEDKQFVWLQRRAAKEGFRVVSVRAQPDVLSVQSVPEGKALGWRKRNTGQPDLTFGAVRFEGVLEIADLTQFLQTLRQGIGRGKAYGFGLLSIARAAA